MNNKYLEKLAFSYTRPDQVYHTFNRRVPNNIWKWGLGGAIVGSLEGLPKTTTEYDTHGREREVKLSTNARIFNGALGALSGGIIGASVGAHLRNEAVNSRINRVINSINKAKDRKADMGSGGSSRFRASAKSVSDILKDLGATGFKTKSEATAHYKKSAMKFHPDRPGGDAEKMKKINAAWDEYKKHPDGFEKLANLYLEKIASALEWAVRGSVLGSAAGGVTSAMKGNKDFKTILRDTTLGAAAGGALGAGAYKGVEQVGNKVLDGIINATKEGVKKSKHFK